MRTGVSLEAIRKEVLIESGFSTSAGAAAFSQERITQMINRTERLMYEMDDWGNLDFEEEVTATADTQIHTMPTNLKFGDIRHAHVKFGTEYIKLTHGIGAAEREAYTTSQRAEPSTRWEVVAPGTTQFELWPIAAVNQTVVFSGQKTLGTMVDEEDVCTLDADVIVLRVAGQILGRDQKDDARLLLDAAGALTANLLKKLGATKSDTINLAGSTRQRLRPGIDYIPPGT